MKEAQATMAEVLVNPKTKKLAYAYNVAGQAELRLLNEQIEKYSSQQPLDTVAFVNSLDKAVEYLFGEKATKIYKVIFVVMILSGAVMTSSLAWDISDTFNGLMMLPNLIGVVVLCPMVMKITKSYVNRKIKGIPEEPVLSHFPDIQAEAAASQTDEV